MSNEVENQIEATIQLLESMKRGQSSFNRSVIEDRIAALRSTLHSA